MKANCDICCGNSRVFYRYLFGFLFHPLYFLLGWSAYSFEIILSSQVNFKWNFSPSLSSCILNIMVFVGPKDSIDKTRHHQPHHGQFIRNIIKRQDAPANTQYTGGWWRRTEEERRRWGGAATKRFKRWNQSVNCVRRDYYKPTTFSAEESIKRRQRETDQFGVVGWMVSLSPSTQPTSILFTKN